MRFTPGISKEKFAKSQKIFNSGRSPVPAENTTIRRNTKKAVQRSATPSTSVALSQRRKAALGQEPKMKNKPPVPSRQMFNLQKRSASPAPPVPTQRQQVAMNAQQRRNVMTQRSSANMAKGGMMKKKGKKNG